MNYSKNKKALHDYEVLEKIEAGLVLTGNNVKSIKEKNVKLNGAFVSIRNNSAWLTNIHIPQYKYSSEENYNAETEIKLLLKKKEIAYLRGKNQEKGLTIIPISLYNKANKIKLEIAIAKGRKLYDKRKVLKERTQKREAQQMIKEIN
jgi:SsrA-binding protein